MTTTAAGPASARPDDAPEVAGRRVLVAKPRGYCAGVDRAVITVEKALDLYGSPVYVRKQIVHNKHVVADLESRGAIFVEELDEVPEGETVVFSWITYKSRAQRDRVNAKVMADKRLAGMMDTKSLPFDAKRMIFGGFESFVKA